MPDAGGMPVSWYVFALLWFFNAFSWAMCVAWTVIAYDMNWERAPAVFLLWIALALGVIISASAGATAWALALMDSRWVLPPQHLIRSSRGRLGAR